MSEDSVDIDRIDNELNARIDSDYALKQGGARHKNQELKVTGDQIEQARAEARTAGINIVDPETAAREDVHKTAEQLDQVRTELEGSKDEALRARPEASGKLRQAQEAWLERRGVLEDTPYLTMTKREFDLLRNVGLGDGGDNTSSLIDKTREKYGIPLDAQYASVDIMPDDVNQPHATELVVVHENDFGTTVDEGRLDSHGIKPEDTPHLTMTKREFDLLRTFGLNGSTSSHYSIR